MRDMERSGLLKRDVEDLPDDAELAERQGQGEAFARPELAVLMAYSKIALYDELIASPVPDDPYFEGDLMAYFPPMLQQRYGEEIKSHRLRREIIATQLVNQIINRAGPQIIVRLHDETGHGAEAIVLAYTATQSVFDLESLNGEIDRLDTKISGEFQLELYSRVQDVLRYQTGWFLRHGQPGRGLSTIIEHFGAGIGSLTKSLDRALTPHQKERREAERARYAGHGVPSALCERLCSLPYLSSGSDIVLVADSLKRPVAKIAPLFAQVAEFFRIDQLQSACESMSSDDYFDRLAINNTAAALADVERSLVRDVVAHAKRGEPNFESWCAENGEDIARAQHRIQEILEGGELTLSRLTVAAAQLRELASD